MELISLKDQKKYSVVKSNKLIEAKYKLTLNEQRLVLLLTSLIKPEDEEFKDYFINLSELKEMLGIKSNDFNRQIKGITKDLLKNPLSIQEENKTIQVNWISSATYFDNEGIVSLHFDPALKPYLLQLKKHFTAYELDNVFKLKSIYSIRLYELLLKEFNYYKQTKTVFIFKLIELKEKLGIEKKEYSQIGEFKSRVLNSAQKELKAKSDIYFEYEGIKKGRKIVKIKFQIILTKKAKKQLENKENIVEIKSEVESQKVVEQEDNITKKLKEWGVFNVIQIREEHSNNVLLDGFKYMDFEVLYRKNNNKEPIKNLGAYFYKILPQPGEPFQFTLHYSKHIQEQDKKQKHFKAEELRKQKEVEEKKRRENERKLLEKRINAKIEDLKLNSPKKWEALNQEAKEILLKSNKTSRDKKVLSAQKNEIIEKIFSSFSDNQKEKITNEALDKAKNELIAIGVENPAMNTITSLKPRKISEIMEVKYQEQISEELEKLNTIPDEKINLKIRYLIKQKYIK